MTNALAVCLLSFFCLAGLSTARQIPKECSKGPEVWCVSLKLAADCGAVGHCISTVWETEQVEVTSNEISDKIVRAFRKLKDVKDLINEDYLATSVSSACRDVAAPATTICKANTAFLETYLLKVLGSKTTPETMCRIIGMCNNMKLDAMLNKKKTVEPKDTKPALLGASRCTWGPAYMCSNFSTGHECKATKFCAQRVWPKKEYPQDNDGICKICTDMVAQARDQLESNETQEELKEVFEGSCNLIPIKIVRKECIKLSDDFVPELVETLASQMNPQAVCSVAGLCNNAKIDKLLEDYNATLALRQGCTNCRTTVTVLKKKFEATSYEDFLIGLLQMCGKAGSLSDSCSMLVFKYYENILAAVKKDLTPQSVCHLSAQCAHKFHSHSLYDFPDEKLDQLTASDDVPCEFCEQLVKHLRDTLLANTTEIEFHKVLVGLCKQTGSFKSECLQLVEQYHSTIYYFLASELNPEEICGFIGICKTRANVPVAPLLPAEIAVKAITPSPKLIGTDEANSYSTAKALPVSSKQANVQILGAESELPPPLPLPVERMFVAVPHDPQRSEALCSFCEYFLHYVQVELSDERTEEAIRKVVENACDVLPDAVNSDCRQFVTQYGPAVIALLVQEIDPSVVCPALELCPKNGPVRKVSINSGKSNCPLCLFAVEQLETMLKNNHSEENIRHALDNLCNHLSAKLRTECVDFVDTYTKQLVEMLVADMDPQEICVFLKLCQDSVADPLKITHQSKQEKPKDEEASIKPIMAWSRGDIETNEIPDHTINGRPVKPTQKTVCVLCEFIMRELDDQIKDKHNDDEIKKIVHGVCKRLPKSVRGECDQFVEKYADLVISLLAQDLEPSEVCRELKLCDPTKIAAVREEILDCAVCETVVMAVKKVLSNDKVDRHIVHIVEKSCNMLPAKYYDRCHTMMEIYGDGVIHLIEKFGTKGVCRKIGLCGERPARVTLYKEHGHGH